MPVTSLKIVKGEIITRIKVITLPGVQSGTAIEAFTCDEEFIPIDRPLRSFDARDEEIYHRELRRQAKEHGQFVEEESTNPEWSPE